jgi:hypothetical protein
MTMMSKRVCKHIENMIMNERSMGDHSVVAYRDEWVNDEDATCGYGGFILH